MPGELQDFRLIFFIVLVTTAPEDEIEEYNWTFKNLLNATEISIESDNGSLNLYINLQAYSLLYFRKTEQLLAYFKFINGTTLDDSVDLDYEDGTMLIHLNEEEVAEFISRYNEKAIRTRLGRQLFLSVQ